MDKKDTDQFHKYLAIPNPHVPFIFKEYELVPAKHFAFMYIYSTEKEPILNDSDLLILKYEGTCELRYDPKHIHYDRIYWDNEGIFYEPRFISHSPIVIGRCYIHPEKLPPHCQTEADYTWARKTMEKYAEIMKFVEAEKYRLLGYGIKGTEE